MSWRHSIDDFLTWVCFLLDRHPFRCADFSASLDRFDPWNGVLPDDCFFLSIVGFDDGRLEVRDLRASRIFSDQLCGVLPCDV